MQDSSTNAAAVDVTALDPDGSIMAAQQKARERRQQQLARFMKNEAKKEATNKRRAIKKARKPKPKAA